MKFLFSFSNSRFVPHIEYVFDHIARLLGIGDFSIHLSGEKKPVEHEDIVISYGKKPPALQTPFIHIAESGLFSEDYLKPESLPALPLAEWKSLPILFGKKPDSGDWVDESENKIISHIDIIAGIFFLLSRCEELIIQEKDKYGRFPADASLLTKAGILHRPIADEYVELLLLWIRKLKPIFERRFPLRDHPFCLYVTHDVDAPLKYSWKGVLGFRQSLIQGLSTLLGFKKDPYWNFSELLALDRKYRVQADYFFLAGGTHPLDHPYSLDHPRILGLVRNLHDSGCGIGIHFSLSSHLDLLEMEKGEDAKEIFEKETSRFRDHVQKLPVGSRQHYLAIKIPETWRALESAGIVFDTTAGFAEIPGFRCGTCHPYFPFDAEKERPLLILEIPLIAMDTTFLHYMKSSPNKALEEMESLLLEVEKHHGIFCLLWHNHTLFEEDYPGWRECYRRFLEICRAKNPLLSNPVRYYKQGEEIFTPFPRQAF